MAASDRDFPLIFSVFGHREAAHARLWQSKVPQPGVDLSNMAAPPRVRASELGLCSTICTAALKCVLLLAAQLAAVLMWNSWGCIFRRNFRPERMELDELGSGRPQPFRRREWEQVRARIPGEFPSIPWFQQSSSEVRERREGADENQVKRNVLVATVVGAHPSNMGRSIQWKNSWGRTNHVLSRSISDSATS